MSSAPTDGVALRWALSDTFTVTHGPVVQLASYQTPENFVARNLLKPQPIILLLDAGSNAVKEASWQTVSVKLIASDGSITALGSATAEQGVVAFKNTGLPSFATAAARLQYTCDPCAQGHAAISLQSPAFDVAEFGGAKTIRLATDIMTSRIYGGVVFAQQPVISMLDGGGRLVTADSITVVRATAITQMPYATWSISSDLLGTTEVTAVRGTASFTDLRIKYCNDPSSLSCVPSQVRLRFSTQTLSPSCAPFPLRSPLSPPPCVPADSTPLTVRVGAAVSLEMLQHPSASGASPDACFTTPPIVVIADAGGNFLDVEPASYAGMSVEAQLLDAFSGTVLPRAQLFGRTVVAASALAGGRPALRFHFTDLGARTASTFRLLFTANIPVTNEKLRPVESAAFSIAVGAAAALEIHVQPGSGFGGLALSQQPTIYLGVPKTSNDSSVNSVGKGLNVAPVPGCT